MEVTVILGAILSGLEGARGSECGSGAVSTLKHVFTTEVTEDTEETRCLAKSLLVLRVQGFLCDSVVKNTEYATITMPRPDTAPRRWPGLARRGRGICKR